MTPSFVRVWLRKVFVWTTIAGVYIGSLGQWNLPSVAAAEVDKKQPSVEGDTGAPSQTDVLHPDGNAIDDGSVSSDLESRVSERVTEFKMAQAQTSPIVPEAEETLANALEADANGNNVVAALLSFDVTKRFSGSIESREAMRLLSSYALRMQKGEFSNEQIRTFDAALPSYQQAATIDTRIVLMTFWINAAWGYRKIGVPGDVYGMASKAAEAARTFVTEFPNSYQSFYATYVYLSASDILGNVQREEAVEWLKGFCRNNEPSWATCGSRAVLAQYYNAINDPSAATAARLKFYKDWGAIDGSGVLNGSAVLDDAKSFILMHLGLAQQTAQDYEGALASFEIAGNLLPEAGHPTAASVFYATRLRYQLNPTDHESARAGYQEFVARFPNSSFTDDAMLEIATTYTANDEYDQAYAAYEAIVAGFPQYPVYSTALSNMDYILKRELARASAGQEEQAQLAMACGPVALHYLFAEFGFESSVPTLVRLAKTTSKGTTMANLIAAANELGMDLRGIRVNSLEDLNGPFIAYLRGEHFVLVKAHDDKSVMVQEMNRPASNITREIFEKDWSGEALCTQGTYRVAQSLDEDYLSRAFGGNSPELCELDPNDDAFFCHMITIHATKKKVCPTRGQPPTPGTCPSCLPLPGGDEKIDIPNAKATDPWVQGPGMPRTGLHQSGTYLDMGIPAHVGTVSVEPFTLETRIDRTDLVVHSRGTLEFNLTKTYSNPYGGPQIYRDYCHGYDICVWWHEDIRYTDVSLCNTREYSLLEQGLPAPSWKSNVEPEMVSDDDGIWFEGRLYVEDGSIYVPADGQDDSFIQEASGYLQFVRQDGHKLQFGSSGLQWVEDEFGNRMTYTRSSGALIISFPSPDTRTVWLSPDRNMVEFRDGSTLLKTITYGTDTDMSGVYDFVRYDDGPLTKYYRTSKWYNDEEIPDPNFIQNFAGCDHYLGRRPDLLQLNYIGKIVDRKGNEYVIDMGPDIPERGPSWLRVDLPSGLGVNILRTAGGDYSSHEATVDIYPTGRTMTYKLDSNDLLSERQFYNYDATNYETWTYEYNSNGLLTEVNSPGATGGTTIWARYGYDGQGRLTTVKRGPGSTPPTWTWAYTTGYPYPTTYTDPTGVATSWSYLPTNHGVLEKHKPPVALASTDGFVFSRNSHGEITGVTDSLGKYWTYDYDDFGNLNFAETPLNETVDLEWNALGQLKVVSDPMDKRTEFDYVPDSSCGSCGPIGSLKEVKRFFTVGGTEYHHDTNFVYDANGNLTDATDPGGDTVHYAYDTMNQVTSIKFPYGVTGEKTTSVSWKQFGRVASITDAATKVTAFGYDHAYRLNLVNDALSAGPVTLAYTRFGNLKTVTDALSHVWTYSYDDKQRLTDITDGLTGILSSGKNLHYVLDAAGRVTEVSAGTGAGNGGTYPITYTYDTTDSSRRGVLTRVDYGAGHVGGYAVFDYNLLGALTTLDDSFKDYFGLPVLTYGYDDDGRLETLYDGTDTLSYAYNAAGGVTDMTDWEGTTTHYGYNDLHELTALTFLYGTGSPKTWGFAYNAAGQPDAVTHPNGMTTDYTYDSNGVLTGILHKNTSTGAVKQGFYYDEYDDVYNIKKVRHEDGSYWRYTYDDRYRLTGAVRHNANDTIQATYGYAYDNGDNMTGKTEPWTDDFADGGIDTADWSKSGTWNVVSGQAKNNAGAFGASMYKAVADDDIEYRYAYTIESYSAGTPYVETLARFNTTSSAKVVVHFEPSQAQLKYWNGTAFATTYTNTGVTSTLGAKYNVRVELDGAHVRVWRSTGGGQETLVFDKTDAPAYNGDRLSFLAGPTTVISLDDVMILAGDTGMDRTTALTYRNNNEIDQVTDYNGAASYTFDAWCRMNTEAKNSVTKTYSWTSANLLAGIDSSASGDTDVTYTYTGDLKRVRRYENSTLTNVYQWDAGFNVLNEFSNVNPMKTFVPGLAEVSGNSPGTSATYSYLTTDHLGSTRGTWNGSGTQTGSWEFSPYGSPYNFAGPGDVTQLYTGHDLDKVTGQYYAAFRYLNPMGGLWINQDPLGMVNGTNMNRYVYSNPLNFIDILGLEGDASDKDGWFDKFTSSCESAWKATKAYVKKLVPEMYKQGTLFPDLKVPARPPLPSLPAIDMVVQTQEFMPWVVVNDMYHDKYLDEFLNNPEANAPIDIPSSKGMPGVRPKKPK